MIGIFGRPESRPESLVWVSFLYSNPASGHPLLWCTLTQVHRAADLDTVENGSPFTFSFFANF